MDHIRNLMQELDTLRLKSSESTWELPSAGIWRNTLADTLDFFKFSGKVAGTVLLDAAEVEYIAVDSDVGYGECIQIEHLSPTGYYSESFSSKWHSLSHRLLHPIDDLYEEAVSLSGSHYFSASSFSSCSQTLTFSSLDYQWRKAKFDSTVDAFASHLNSVGSIIIDWFSPNLYWENLSPIRDRFAAVVKGIWTEFIKVLEGTISTILWVSGSPKEGCLVDAFSRIGATSDVFRKKWFFVVCARHSNPDEVDNGKFNLAANVLNVISLRYRAFLEISYDYKKEVRETAWNRQEIPCLWN